MKSTIFIIFIITVFSSCKKFVEVEAPSNNILGASIFSSDATANSVLIGLYSKLSSTSGSSTVSFLTALSADELKLYSGVTNSTLVAFYKNALTTSISDFIWPTYYQYIFQINSVLEGLTSSTTLTPSVKQQLIGEAYFLRAFYFFYLTNLYGDIPLTITSDYRINASLARSPKAAIYTQIISDLHHAQSMLNDNYVGANSIATSLERIRPNKYAATALLARVFLYNVDWINAEAEATTVISNTALYDTVSLSDVFLKNSNEAIWQLQPVNTGWNTEDARVLVLNSAPSNTKPVYLSSFLLNSFETGDNRRTDWIKDTTYNNIVYSYANKYKSAVSGSPVTEYQMVLRLSEQYLIRAEARAHLNKITEGLHDLNVIRHRAGLPDTNASDQNSLLNLIYHERQAELFTEWGHRWFDLKRTATIDVVMSVVTPIKGGTWETTDQLYPIPLTDIRTNPNLSQNPGY